MRTRAKASNRHGSSGCRPVASRTPASPLADGRAGFLRNRRASCPRFAVPAVVLSSVILGFGATAQTDPFISLRRNMVDNQVKKHGVKQPGVLAALATVPRHLFVPGPNQPEAYKAAPVPFAPGKNLSSALVSARMIEELQLDGDEKVLEIGTGSGYDAALLSQLARQVYTIEIDKTLANQAKKTLRKLGFRNVEVRNGDGYRGWPEKAPFDAILVTVSTLKAPEPLYDQLKMGGRMVVAVGDLVQEMQLIIKTPEGRVMRPISLVNLGPMTGEVNQQDRR